MPPLESEPPADRGPQAGSPLGVVDAGGRIASMSLREQIESLATREAGNYSDADFALFNDFKAALNRGEIRAAERDANGKWHTNAWVKRGILLGFRMGL